MYPRANFVPIDWSNAARTYHQGKCNALILPQRAVAEMRSGEWNRKDCEKLAAGRLTAEEAHCSDSRRDCLLEQVGPIVVQLGFSMPLVIASSKLSAGLWSRPRLRVRSSALYKAGRWKIRRNWFVPYATKTRIRGLRRAACTACTARSSCAAFSRVRLCSLHCFIRRSLHNRA